MPKHLFHYRKFVEAHLVSLLCERKVKLSRPDSFNDPWDCRVHFELPTDATGRRRVVEWISKMHRNNYPAIDEAERARRAEDLIACPLLLQEAYVKLEEQMYRAICQSYRVYCLSEKPDQPLMWAHYADSHKGICLEFNARAAPFTRTSGATQVEYRHAYPAHDLVTVGHEPLITKSAHWSYEVEWRLIAEEREFAKMPDTLKTDDDFLILPHGVLKSVTIGCLASEDSRRSIKHLVQTHAPEVLVREAKPAADQYELIIFPAF